MFCTRLSHFGYAVQLLPGRGFSYRTCDEEMSKPLLILTLMKIISRYQWYISLSISYLLSIVYLNISQRTCIESINISRRIVLTITKIAVAIRFVQQLEEGDTRRKAMDLKRMTRSTSPYHLPGT